jgi:hypothetical protein
VGGGGVSVVVNVYTYMRAGMPAQCTRMLHNARTRIDGKGREGDRWKGALILSLSLSLSLAHTNTHTCTHVYTHMDTNKYISRKQTIALI